MRGERFIPHFFVVFTNAFKKGMKKRPLIEFFVRKEIRIIRIISPRIDVLLIRDINFIFGEIILIILISFRSCVAAKTAET